MSSQLLDETQVQKAVKALLKHIEKQRASSKPNVLEEDELLYMTIALVKTPQGPRKDKPVRLPVPHPLFQFEGAEVCLFVKDHKGEGHKEAKARAKAQKGLGVAKIVGLSKLRSKFESHEAKRQLCASYDLFLADERVIPSLPKLLGKTFFRKKKQPIPVDLRGKDWRGRVARAAQATYLYPPTGNCLNIRVARSSFPVKDCTENVMAALAEAVQHIPQKQKNVRAVYLKTADSVALPLYQRSPETGQPESPAPEAVES